MLWWGSMYFCVFCSLSNTESFTVPMSRFSKAACSLPWPNSRCDWVPTLQSVSALWYSLYSWWSYAAQQNQRMNTEGLCTYEDFLLSWHILLRVDCHLGSSKLVLRLVLAHTGLALSVNTSKILTESVFDVVANQNSSSVRVLRVSNFGMERHIC